MGHGIAKNLIEKGFSISVMAHKNRAPLQDLLEKGAVEATSPKEMAQKSEIILLCVTGSPQVEQCIYGDNGLISSWRYFFWWAKKAHSYTFEYL